MPRVPLAAIEPVDEVSESAIEGWLVLLGSEDFYELAWSPLETSPNKHVMAIFQDFDRATSEWAFGNFMKFDCREIATVRSPIRVIS
jgi:hypothetical protein